MKCEEINSKERIHNWTDYKIVKLKKVKYSFITKIPKTKEIFLINLPKRCFIISLKKE